MKPFYQMACSVSRFSFAVVVNCSVILLWGSLALAAERTDASGAAAVVVHPHVSTDQSVDCSTVQRIVDSLVKKEMTDEQKVLAVFNWTRRMIYHGDGQLNCAYDFHSMIHVQGHGSCLRQTTPMALLLEKLGFECRNWVLGGHHLMEVRYDDRWHCFDPHMCFYVRDRSSQAHIASVAQLQADPTLATAAVKENRACPGFLLCGDDPSMFEATDRWQNYGKFPEAKKYTLTVNEPFGQIALRRGETYTRTWQPGAYWYFKNFGKKNMGPCHSCGGRDRKDTVNFPLYEPHAWRGGYYRHWGTGQLVYRPELTGDHYRDAVVTEQNLQPARAGLAAKAAGEVVFSVACPYALTAGEFEAVLAGEGKLQVSVSTDQGKNWLPVELEQQENKVAGRFVEPVNGVFSGYWIKLQMSAGTTISSLAIRSHFQLNIYSLPYLVPGKNRVTIEAERYGSPLTVQWKYAEGPEWKKEKTARQVFEKNGQLTIDVEQASGKYPRNIALTLSVAP